MDVTRGNRCYMVPDQGRGDHPPTSSDDEATDVLESNLRQRPHVLGSGLIPAHNKLAADACNVSFLESKKCT